VRWGLPTRIRLASKLLSSWLSAGLVKTNRVPRPLLYPRVGDEALTYLMFLLREVEFAGTVAGDTDLILIVRAPPATRH